MLSVPKEKKLCTRILKCSDQDQRFGFLISIPQPIDAGDLLLRGILCCDHLVGKET